MNRLACKHEVSFDRENLLVDVRLSGFFSPYEAHLVGEDVRRIVNTLGETVGAHVTLYDATDALIVTSDTIETIDAAFECHRSIRARRIAFVSPLALGRMQIERLRKGAADFGIFADRASAIAWLLETEAALA